MSTRFISRTTASSAAATNLVLAQPDDVQEGDILYLLYAVGDVAAEGATLTVPTGWKFVDASTSGAFRILRAFKYATDDEDATYTFTYTASRDCAAVLLNYRGPARDFDYDVINYPDGFPAPDGSLDGIQTGTSTTLDSNTGAVPATAVEDVMVVYAFLMYSVAASSPTLDDPSPLIAVRARVNTTKLALMIADELIADAITPVPQVSVNASISLPWLVRATVLESYIISDEEIDNYKSKLIRQNFPPPYDARLSSNLGKLLAVIGTSDNDLGGLFGEEDFLPDEET